MMAELHAVLDLPGRDQALRSALEGLDRTEGRVAITGLSAAAAAVLLPSLLDRAPGGKLVLLVPGEKEAEQFRSDLAFAAAGRRGPAARVLLFPSLEADPYQELEPHLRVACERVQALRALRDPGEAIVVAPTRALIYALARPQAFDAYRLDLSEKQAIRPDDLSGFLLDAGYLRVDLVSAAGEFSRRGGIIDFLPPGAAGGVRVEFWGEEIESLRTFDPETQRSTARLERAEVPPVREYPWDAAALDGLRRSLEARRAGGRRAGGSRAPAGGAAAVLRGAGTGDGPDDLAERIEALAAKRTFPGFEACVRLVDATPAALFDYAPEALLVTWEEGQVLSDLETVFVEMHASFDLSEEFGMPVPEELLLPRAGLQETARRARLRLSELGLDEETAPASGRGAAAGRRSRDVAGRGGGEVARRGRPVRVACAPPRAYKGRLHDLAADLEQAPPGTTTLFLMESAGRIERLAEVLNEYGQPPRVLGKDGGQPPRVPGTDGGGAPPRLLVAPGRLSQGFVLTGIGLQVLTEREVFGEHVEREARRRKVAAFSPDFRDLKVGDLVVHVEHGIGRYAGIARMGEGEGERDFMLLSYDGGDKLYVPIDRLDLVQRYSGLAGGPRPRLDRLGGPGWEKTKKKVRKAMEEMARELLELYAARKAARGHAFSPDTPWQKEFEEAFSYEETPDQHRAIREIKADMEGDIAMDRLICGDVGFGKTEVAMRAAFKAVMDGTQVAVLCPTTVLAVQHVNTFRERFSSWPVTIEMISRFRSAREQKAIVVAAAEGKIDVLIGTHRILSTDVRFRDLGLLVVDEEQRFGVRHKEAIKAMKKNVDVLTLTATPIPRTLQMSLAGIRDMSVIETPPENRLAIQTAIVPFREGVIAAALRNELKRGGQVYFVHNRVESIGSMGNLIRKLVPEARVGIAHGQMSEGTLERTMLSFLKGEFDVLLTTTIIENGLDIPRVNTIVVNRADRFGLAQLYQLRGRVGRSDRRAYAYLLVPARKALTPVARRRLKALQEFTELGSGFRIAAMDLEIRGAGNLLGAEQSGHIAAVGFEMYCQLLERAVREMKGEAPTPEFKTQINLGVDIKIPEEYIPDFSERLVLYKRISSAADGGELGRIRDQVRDLYGEVPRQADNLLALAALRQSAERFRIRSIDYSGGRVQVRFAEDAPVSPERLVGLASGRPGLSLTPAGLLRVDLGAWRPGDAGPRVAAGGAGGGTMLPGAGGAAGGLSGEALRMAAVRDLLRALGPGGSMQPTSQPSAVGPVDGDR